jgi:hypothetical protein
MQRSWHLRSELTAIVCAMIVAAAVLASAKEGETHETTFGGQALDDYLVIRLEAGRLHRRCER